MKAAGATRSAAYASPEGGRGVYDLIVVGGGIQGAFLTLEASRRGLRVLLLEKGRIGCGTSNRSLRVIHGGFRYLQSLDFGRCIRSRREQNWFLDNLPDLVRPLPCVLPLDGRGFHRSWVARVACKLDSRVGHSTMPLPRVLDASELRRTLGFDAPGARAGLRWYDAVLKGGRETVVALAEWAMRLGVDVVEEATVTGFVTDGARVRGVTGSHEVYANTVIVAAGVQNERLARTLDLHYPSTGWIAGHNVVLDRPAPFQGGLAFRPARSDQKAFFALPRENRMVIGTLYTPISSRGREVPPPGDEAVARLLVELNRVLPGPTIRREHIAEFDSGLLPVAPRTSTPCDVPRLLGPKQHRGPAGLWFVAPEKLTTARAVAESVLRKAIPSLMPTQSGTGRRSTTPAMGS